MLLLLPEVVVLFGRLMDLLSIAASHSLLQPKDWEVFIKIQWDSSSQTWKSSLLILTLVDPFLGTHLGNFVCEANA